MGLNPEIKSNYYILVDVNIFLQADFCQVKLELMSIV